MAWELLPSPTRPPRAQAPATTTPSLSCAGTLGPQPARPRSGVQVRSSGPPGPLRSGPPAQDNVLQPGLTPSPPPLQGTGRQSDSSTPHRVGLQYPRSLTAATGSTALNRPAPAGEFKLQARVYRCHLGPARLLKVTLTARVLRSRARGRPV